MKLYINILQDTRDGGSYDTGACFTRLEEACDHILKVENSAGPYYKRCRYRGTLIVSGARLRLVNLRWNALENAQIPLDKRKKRAISPSSTNLGE